MVEARGGRLARGRLLIVEMDGGSESPNAKRPDGLAGRFSDQYRNRLP
jgi:hypothetical protein